MDCQIRAQLCAGLLTPHECPTLGLLRLRGCSESKIADEAGAGGEQLETSGRALQRAVGRPTPNIRDPHQ